MRVGFHLPLFTTSTGGNDSFFVVQHRGQHQIKIASADVGAIH